MANENTQETGIDACKVRNNDKNNDYDLPVDTKQNDKAIAIRFLSTARPHMRAFYFAFLCYFLGNILWFTIAPLQTEIRESLSANGFTTNHIWTSNIANVMGCFAGRLTFGPLCDRYGAKRPLVGLLIVIAIIGSLTSIVHTSWAYHLIRFCVGWVGATLVICQCWTSSMFAKEVVGTANAVALGLGYTGVGAAQVVVGSGLFPLLTNTFGMSHEQAWRTVSYIPGLIAIVVALLALRYSDDSPTEYKAKITRDNEVDQETHSEKKKTIPSRSFRLGRKVSIVDLEQKEVSNSDRNKEQQKKESSEQSLQADRENNTKDSVKNNKPMSTYTSTRQFIWEALSNHNTWILFLQFAGCSGTATAMSQVASVYFVDEFDASTSLAGAASSVIGFAAVFCSVGGYWSDRINATSLGVQGRLLLQGIFLFLEGSLLIAFAYSKSLSVSVALLSAISILIAFSIGSTFGILPYTSQKAIGTVAGIVAAGGNFGSIFILLLLRQLPSYRSTFLIFGGSVCVFALLTFGISIKKDDNDEKEIQSNDNDDGDMV